MDTDSVEFAARIRAERAAQRLPPSITDPAALATLHRILRDVQARRDRGSGDQ